MKHIPSPCINRCILNEDLVCTGCFRSVDELGGWRSKSEEEKIEILENIKYRKISMEKVNAKKS